MEDKTKKIITVRNVSKQFLAQSTPDSVLAKIVSIFTPRNIKAKRRGILDVSFEGKSGEVIGVIGKNGSGKSTLLRLIAGIYKQSEGTLNVEGNVMYISGFQHCIKPRLTVRENIFFASSILGLSAKEARGIFDNVLDFAELLEYKDSKVYELSTGMLSRLNFSIFIHAVEEKKPDVILLDEVISAGVDLGFKSKVEAKMMGLVERGATVMIASHLLADLEKYCTRALWIDNGKVVLDTNPKEVINQYRSSFK